MRKKLFLLIVAVFAVNANFFGSAVAKANIYSDLPMDNAAYEAVLELTDDGILSPFDDGTFRGQNVATRYDAAVIFANLCDRANLPETELAQSFADVKPNGEYSDSVMVVTKCGIISGYGDKTFRGEKFITRFDLAMMLAKYMKAANIAADGEAVAMSFVDVPQDHWAYAGVVSVVRNDLMTSRDGGFFDGYKPITRYEVAMIVAKMLKL